MKNKDKIKSLLIDIYNQLDTIDNYCMGTFSNQTFEYMDLITLGKLAINSMEVIQEITRLLEDE